LIQVGNQARADRYTYLPLIGLFLAGVWGLDELTYRWRSRYGTGAATKRLPMAAVGIWIAVLAVLMLHSFSQISYWHDSLTLWHHALEACGESSTAHENLASALREQGDLEGAIRHTTEALRIDAANYAALHLNGLILMSLGRTEEALKL